MSIPLFHNVDRKQQLFIDSQKKEFIAVKNAEYSLSGRLVLSTTVQYGMIIRIEDY